MPRGSLSRGMHCHNPWLPTITTHSIKKMQTHTEDELVRLMGPRLNRDDFDQKTFAEQLTDLGITRGPTLKRTRIPKLKAKRDDTPAEMLKADGQSRPAGIHDQSTIAATNPPALQREPVVLRYFGTSCEFAQIDQPLTAIHCSCVSHRWNRLDKLDRAAKGSGSAKAPFGTYSHVSATAYYIQRSVGEGNTR